MNEHRTRKDDGAARAGARQVARRPKEPARWSTVGWSGLLLLTLILSLAPSRPGQPLAAGRSAGNREHVSVVLSQSRVISLRTEAARVSVADPSIADILVIDPRQVYVIGKQLGTTNLVLWDADDRVRGTIAIEVTPDLDLLKTRLHQVLPGEHVQVRSAQGSIVVSGEVSSPEKANAALQIAQSFAVGQGSGDAQTNAKVLNLLQVGGSQQVMLEVKVAEIARSFVKRLDVNFTSLYNGGSIRIGTVGSGTTFNDFINPDGLRLPAFDLGDGGIWGPPLSAVNPAETTIQDTGIFLSSLSGNFLFNLVIDAAKNKGLAKILAEPNLTTLSGQEAKFLAGGEFPIPVPQDNQTTTIDYKEYGVGVVFVPVVLDSNVISVKVNVVVSELTNQNSITLPTAASGAEYFIPALTKRSANSTVEVRPGQTIAIAGLINETLRENVSKFPGLGDIPVLGALFRSQQYVKGQTELMIFVTPRLARSFNPDLVSLPTDSFVEPNDVEFYLMGRIEGRRNRGSAYSSGGGIGPDKAGTEGFFGHDL